MTTTRSRRSAHHRAGILLHRLHVTMALYCEMIVFIAERGLLQKPLSRKSYYKQNLRRNKAGSTYFQLSPNISCTQVIF